MIGEKYQNRRNRRQKTPSRLSSDKVRGSPSGEEALDRRGHAHESLGKWLKQVRFKRCLFGGVSETDVWRKINELNSLYEAALSAERARYDALIEEAVHAKARQLANQIIRKWMESAQHEKKDGGG